MKKTDPSHSHQNCMELFEQLSDYIDRELDTVTCKEIEAHIHACEPCQICLNTLKQTVELCQNLEHHQVPEMFTQKLKAAIFDLVEEKTE